MTELQPADCVPRVKADRSGINFDLTAGWAALAAIKSNVTPIGLDVRCEYIARLAVEKSAGHSGGERIVCFTC